MSPYVPAATVRGSHAGAWAQRAIFLVLFAGFCTLFTGLETKTPLLIVKPFDIVCLLLVPPLLIDSLSKGIAPRSLGLVLLLSFFAAHAGSALIISPENALRETLQVIQLSIFGAALALFRSELDWHRMAIAFVIVAIAITAYNVHWHVSHGFVVGWKRLDEPKLLFSYAVPVVFALMLFRRRRASILDYAIIALIAVVLLLSGERKAQVGFMLCLAILAIARFAHWRVLICGSLLAAAPLAMLTTSDEYLARQFRSFFERGSELTISQLESPDLDLTLSNAQRALSARVSAKLITENMWFGVGTNGYLEHVRQKYWDYPAHLRTTSIHNEFLRVLVENGIVGLILYLAPWVRSALFGLWLLRGAAGRITATYAMLYTVLLLQCASEGGGNEAFLAFLMVALLPELVTAANSARHDRHDLRSRSAPSSRVVRTQQGYTHQAAP